MGGCFHPHQPPDRNCCVYIVPPGCFGGAVLTKDARVSAPPQLLSPKTAGHVGISSVNTEAKKEGWRVHVGTKAE